MADGGAAFTGATVLVCGAGLAGRSAVEALLRRRARVLLTDRDRGAAVDTLVAAGARFVGAPEVVPPGVDVLVTSPGWRPDHPLLHDAVTRGIGVLGEVEFAWQLRRSGAAPWLAVTGTNGKTTTVRMLESVLR